MPPALPSGRRLLVADDDADYVDVVCALAEWLGHECHGALTGVEAIAIAGRLEFDVVLVDITLPDMSGFDVARAIRRLGRHQPYLVAVTGWLHVEHRERALDAGFDAHLNKPLTIDMLEKLVETGTTRARVPCLAVVR